MTTLQIRVDDELKEKADELFKDLGTDTTTAVRIFLKQAVMNDGFPFEIKRKGPIPVYSQDELYAKLEKSRQSVEQGKVMRAYDMMAEANEKYGL